MKGQIKRNLWVNELKILGARIKYLREERNLTQEELAEKANLDRSYITKIENGHINTTVRYLIEIAHILKIKVKDLLDF